MATGSSWWATSKRSPRASACPDPAPGAAVERHVAGLEQAVEALVTGDRTVASGHSTTRAFGICVRRRLGGRAAVMVRSVTSWRAREAADPLVPHPGLAHVLAVAGRGDQQHSAHRAEAYPCRLPSVATVRRAP